MQAHYSDNLLVLASKKELQLLKAGAQGQADLAKNLADSALYPDIRDIWNKAYTDYKQLVADIEVILKSMPF